MNDSNTEIFTKSFEKYGDVIFRHLYFRLSDRSRAKEITHDTFLRFWKTLSSGEDVENVRAYLYKISHNLYVNELRDRKHHLSLDELHEEQNFDPKDDIDERMILSLDAKIVQDLFTELNEVDKTILTYRFVDDFSIKEIAENLDETENNISVRLHRAIKKIRTLVDERIEKNT